VLVSFQPGELILLRGEPNYLSVPATTTLLWVSNTDSDVFRMGKTGAIYYLVAGRWFSAPDFTGPWTFATPSLPEEFKKIPLEHDRSRVLASVPGTDQAAEAVLIAQVPQTARVSKKQTKAPDVAFQGDPQFTPIEKTTVQRAVNTDKDVFLIDGKYYMCYQGVWFVGAAATGPWEVASSVPQQIYQIPASSPSHHVTYVTVEDDDDDEWVTFAAAAGYTGMMVAWGCTVWGTGYYYPPYYGYGGYYPYYYPYMGSYGYSAWYNPWTGAYGRSAGVYGPYGGAGVGARYNPRTGTYARGAAAYGPGGARRGAGVQPAHRHLRHPTPGLERLRELGLDLGAARRRLGEDQSLHEQPHRHDDALDPHRRRLGHHTPRRRRRPSRGRRWRQRVRREGRQRLSPPGRHVAEVRQRRLVEHRPAAQRRAAAPDHRPGDHHAPHGATRSQHGRSAQS
jgi:hypothetical protein